jgi:predicted nucleotidyltransferase component of viral defense system
MLSTENLEKYTSQFQTSLGNVVREYCQHLFLSYLYQEPSSEKLLFKGGTALRIIFGSPRFSEDLDFTGSRITHKEIEGLIASALSNIEKTGIPVEVKESKETTGGYLGIVTMKVDDQTVQIQVEVSLRGGKSVTGTRAVIQNDFIPAYTLVHLPTDQLIGQKIEALLSRQKPRDFYDYYYLLSGNYVAAKEKQNLRKVLDLVKKTKVNFRNELRKFLPASQAMHLKDFRKVLIDKINTYIG